LQDSLGVLLRGYKGGYIDPLKDGYYDFTHDKLHMLFQSLLVEGEEEHIYVLIGEAYITHRRSESSAYRAAFHLNCTQNYPSDDHISEQSWLGSTSQLQSTVKRNPHLLKPP
jgi:hypothetical protein